MTAPCSHARTWPVLVEVRGPRFCPFGGEVCRDCGAFRFDGEGWFLPIWSRGTSLRPLPPHPLAAPPAVDAWLDNLPAPWGRIYEDLKRMDPKHVPAAERIVGPAYSERVGPVVYGPATGDFTPADWLDLALAALDQAGLYPTEREAVNVALQGFIQRRGLDR